MKVIIDQVIALEANADTLDLLSNAEVLSDRGYSSEPEYKRSGKSLKLIIASEDLIIDQPKEKEARYEHSTTDN